MIELKSICAGYSGNNVINNVSLKLPKGKLISVIGANGSGKSTLLKTTVGIIAPSSGEIQVDNIPSADLSRRDIAKRISYLAQGRRVADMTVEQMVLHGRFPHIKYPRRYSEKDRVIAAEALKKWGFPTFPKDRYRRFREARGKRPILQWRLCRTPIIFCLMSLLLTWIYRLSLN